MSLSAPPRGFPASEFEARTAKAQALMAEDGLGALLLTTEPEVRYFSGFLTQFWQSPTRPWFLVVPAEGKPIAVIPGIGAECMARTWIEDIRIWSSPAPEDDGISLLAETLREVLDDGSSQEKGEIGLPLGRESHLRLPLRDFAHLRDLLDGHRLADATPLMRQLRDVKSEREIEKIAFACDAVSSVFEDLPSFISTGMRDDEAFRAVKIACLKAGVDDVSYLVGGAGQGGYGDIISPPAGRVIQEGDVLIFDTGCLYDGYFCDFDRNWGFSDVDDAAKRAHEVVWNATEAGLAAARPGAVCADLFQAMQAVLSEGGALGNDVGRMGHGLGMQLTEGPSHTSWDQTKLVPGMVLTLEPGMVFAPGKVMVHEENIVVRDEGPQLLTRRAPKELPIIR